MEPTRSVMHIESPIGRFLATAGALLFLPLSIIVDATISTSQGWSPASAGAFAKLPTLGWLFLALAAALLLMPFSRRILTRLTGKLWLANASLVCAVLISECVLRFTKPEAFHCRPSGARYEYDPDPLVVPGVSGIAHSTMNSRGIRGPELPRSSHVYRVLCIGGSACEGWYLDDPEDWASQLMNSLQGAGHRVYVASAGYGDYASGHHLRFIQDSPVVGEMNCIVLMPGVNDFLRVLLGFDSGVAPPPRFIDCAITRCAKQLWNVRLRRGIIVDRTGQELAVRERGLRLIERDIHLGAALDDFATTIRAIAAACKQRKLRLICVSQPVLWDDFLTSLALKRLRIAPVDPQPREWKYLTPGNCREAIDQYNDRLQAVCREQELEFVDASDAMSGIEQYFFDDYRFTESGCKKLAEMVENSLKSAVPQPGHPPPG